MNKKQSHSSIAFTLIELLVVIAIISLLSSVVLASLSGARESAKVTRMVSDLKQIETAMTMWMQSTGRTQWPHNDDGYSRIMENLVDNTSLSDHLTSLPGPPFGSTGYRYDNNNNGGNSEFTGCGDYTAAAVNIFVRDVPEEVIKKISDIVENNSELGCHKVRQYDGSDLWYMISDNQSF